MHYTKNNLSLFRTYKAITRTYLAQIRTGIFCGLSMILIKKKY